MSELDFPAWLTAMSKAMGFDTDAALAVGLGVSPSTILRWRTGSRPTVRHLVTLSRVLGTRLEPLLALAGHVGPDDVGAFAEVPEPPALTTEAVRKIKAASLSDKDKGELLAYWDKRQGEEKSRLYLLIRHLEKRSEPGYVFSPHWGLSVAATALPQHLEALLNAVDQASPRPRKR